MENPCSLLVEVGSCRSAVTKDRIEKPKYSKSRVLSWQQEPDLYARLQGAEDSKRRIHFVLDIFSHRFTSRSEESFPVGSVNKKYYLSC
jgi:hypothetical protein